MALLRAKKLSSAARSLALWSVGLLAIVGPAQATPLWQAVVDRARDLAQEPYSEARPAVPDWLDEITYDQWRDIRFKGTEAFWNDGETPFQVQLFHPGFYYNRPVAVNLVEDGRIVPVPFSPSRFDYGQNDFASRVPSDLGHAGFRLHAPLKSKSYFDEVIVFLGASYFRAVGRDQAFGISARGLAIDTAEPWGEEFPHFREFWIERPPPGASEIVVYGLLDSPSIAGALRLIVHPRRDTLTDVSAVFFPRRDVRTLGIAPLTSMFFHGENSGRHFDDFRPEAHDSDGLLVHLQNGEWMWRPLDNPKSLQVTSFEAVSPRGFGLIQRDRSFESYQDLETRYEMRPSVWVEPVGAWGPGRIRLVEIPTKSEANDNVVVFWVPGPEVKPGSPIEVAYRLHWYGENLERPSVARAVATRRDKGRDGETERFVVDFVGPELDAVPPEVVLEGRVSARRGDDPLAVVRQHIVKNPILGGYRLTFEVRGEPTDMRAVLLRDGKPLSETWTFAARP